MKRIATVKTSWKLCALACAILFGALAPRAIAAPQASTDDTSARITRSMVGLDRFRSTHSLSDLQSAIDTLVSAVDIVKTPSGNYLEDRRLVVGAWAKVLREIETSYDPTFNPKNPHDLPLSCVPAPLEANGSQLKGCADPQEIQDPKARAEYIAEVRANDAKLVRANFQTRLSYLDDDAMVSLHGNLQDFRRVAPSDAAALTTILRQAGLSETRIRKIEPWLQ